MTDFADRLKRLPPEQRTKLLQRLRGSGGDAGGPVLTRRAHEARTRPSFQQEQMWFLDRLGGPNARNNIVLSVRLDGTLDVDALQTAVDVVVARHELLHSRLVEVDGAPWQERMPGAKVVLTHTDVSDAPDPDAAFADYVAQDGSAGFDLAQRAPVRARLLRLGHDRHVLLWVVHHIVWDPGSTRVFTDELTAAYADAVSGAPSSLADLPVQYADFAAWQRERLATDLETRLSDYWGEQLAGSAATEVPTDHPRTSATSAEGRGLHTSLEPSTLDKLKQVAVEHDATIFVALLAAFNAVLARWTRVDDVVVGTAGVRRHRPELHGLVGCFVEMMTLRTPVEPTMSYRDLVAATRNVVMDAFKHGDLPFERVVERVQPPRDPLRHPLFQIEFTSVGGWGVDVREAGGITFAVEQLHDGAAKFDLSMVTAESDTLDLSLEFNTSLYREETAGRVLDAYRDVLRQVSADPDVRVEDLHIVDQDEHERLTGALTHGQPVVEAAVTTTIAQQFRTQAAATPTASALRFRDATVDYATLDRWSDRVATELSARGVAADTLVVVSVPRGPAAIAAVLGVLKAGGAYLPVDPHAPESWVAQVVETSGVRHAIVGGDATLQVDGLDVLVVSDHARDATDSVAVMDDVAGPTDRAYVLFTSGSTGRPKGVEIEQRSVCHFTAAITDDYDIHAGDRLLAFAPLTFDVSVFELFSALLTGAELVVADDAERRDPALLQDLMRRARVTVAELPPALMPLLDPDSLPDLRLVSVGGEAFPGSLVAPWAVGGRRFVNGYGPTETTVAVTLKDCVGEWDRTPPIGRPMAGHQALVLDEGLRPVPVGAPGELCIAGPGVARGYLGDPDQTAARFPANPYPAHAHADRLYRTGDLVRWLPDGDIEFLGRIDRQIKLRGFRIEPGEVESALADHPDVAQAAVVVTGGDGSERALVGFVVPRNGKLDTDEVRAHVSGRLPAHMVPVVVALDVLPLTRSGKIDHATLSRTVVVDGAEKDVTGPRDDLEATILDEVVLPILGRDSLDVEADFFASGGSSLQATSVVARVRELTGTQIDLADFFAAPTVASLATLVRGAGQERDAEDQRLQDVLAQIEQLSEEEAAEMLRSMSEEPSGGGA